MEKNNFHKKKIAYIVPELQLSGGIAIVLNHVNRLRERGYDTLILTCKEENKCNQDWFDNKIPYFYVKNQNKDFFDKIDIAIATHWTTAYILERIPVKRKVYFVQSDERRFFPVEEQIKEVEKTYEMNFEFMTEAVWIQKWLKEEFNHDSYYVPNGLDLNLFCKTDPILPKTKKARVLLEGSIDVWFKGMEDAYNAVKDLDCQIWIVSANGKPKKNWRYDAFFNTVPIAEMKKMYSSCDIFLKMSRVEGFFGPPMEAMACGCSVVVGKVTGYDEYIKNKHNALVVEQLDVNGAKKAVERLIRDKELSQKLIINGIKTAKNWNWDKSIDLLERMIEGDSPKIFYSEEFPEKYDPRNEIKKMKEGYRKFNDSLSSHTVEKLDKIVEEQKREIEFIRSSKFWKLRDSYIKLKNILR